LSKNTFFIALLIILISAASGFAGWKIARLKTGKQILPTSTHQPERVFDSYSIETLSDTDIKPGMIEIIDVIGEEENFISYKFAFTFLPNPEKNYKKKTTGLINIPKKSRFNQSDSSPAILIMIRGYVDQEIYQTGTGTKRAGEYFANNGFVTVAPDFLGYAESDSESENIFETRFQTYTTILSLLKTIESFPTKSDLIRITGNPENQILNFHLGTFKRWTDCAYGSCCNRGRISFCPLGTGYKTLSLLRSLLHRRLTRWRKTDKKRACRD
jgi:hypothetical protein